MGIYIFLKKEPPSQISFEFRKTLVEGFRQAIWYALANIKARQSTVWAFITF